MTCVTAALDGTISRLRSVPTAIDKAMKRHLETLISEPYSADSRSAHIT